MNQKNNTQNAKQKENLRISERIATPHSKKARHP